jgi:hypothetical protein
LHLVYPRQPHGIQNPRYQLVKMKAEFGWFEHWIRGREKWLDWNAILATASRVESRPRPVTAPPIIANDEH